MTWDNKSLCLLLSEVNELRGELLGKVSMFGFEEQNESMLNSLTQEILHSAKIEGEELNHDSIRSSLARQLGLPYEGLPEPDHYTEGVVQVMVDAISHYDEPFEGERFFAWHTALFPMGRSGMYRISVGTWRTGDESMQVVSGALGHQKVHYEAPGSELVPSMMQTFIDWLNGTKQIDPVLKAAVAHLWFVTIHPFDDGNGRICRTLTELLLSRADKTSHRYYSLSSEILQHRKAYYEHLERAQKGELDVTEWIEWFLSTLKETLLTALLKTRRVALKTTFWQRHQTTALNERQRKVLNMMLDGFDGKLTSSKWYKINHCSQDTANRDIRDLVDKGVLRASAERGRNTNYLLVEE